MQYRVNKKNSISKGREVLDAGQIVPPGYFDEKTLEILLRQGAIVEVAPEPEPEPEAEEKTSKSTKKIKKKSEAEPQPEPEPEAEAGETTDGEDEQEPVFQ